MNSARATEVVWQSQFRSMQVRGSSCKPIESLLVSRPLCIFQCCTLKNREGLVDFHGVMDEVYRMACIELLPTSA